MPAISTNTAANSAVRYLNINSAQETSSLSKLASGSRITSASDDAAGLAISTRISSDVTTLQQAATNASQAVAILQTADGGASNISDILARMKSLASESASGTTTDSSRAYINSEFSQLSSQIDSIASGTRYSSQSLLDGTSVFASGVAVLVGTQSSDSITITLSNLKASTLGVSTLDVSSLSGATTALSALDTAINTVSSARASIGAQESRFNFSADSISTQTQNLQSANSAIKDVDIAAEQAKLSSAEVKTQAAVSAEAAANQMPQYLLKLLG
ncbi:MULTISPECIES: flagellin [Rhodopseudomonas]|jgi:flagellin|uniref:Flagellin n=2 Tax=Rhodopseudomonas palustris TaxID=1076 RepID=Q6NC33_RHOPA|nr:MULTISPECIES: flagellin [Rhodopseudomonas]ACE99266.1 flagellin domain protein [Rhodopseudomonas palustris TIE-1]AVT74713.1 flagellin [Rhodopseudomonas palustris]AVT79528.1 flagellin [Rhodopseudomonas palustris]NEV75760.1 flagellin [Rhodopseudomonas sp. BR0C11]NEW95817.1 flagellin [Rhodopseudomonas sp. BR0G17]